MTASWHAVDPREAAQIAYWNDRTALHWAALQDRIETVFAPLTRLGLDAAAPCPGEHVLDIGCGCGDTVLALANAVGPAGHVLGVDVSAPMTARARERLAEAGIGHADVVVADAADHAFPPAQRDLLFSRFGVMFFAEPEAAAANLRCAMRSGGRLCWVVYRALEDNPWFTVPLQAASPWLPPSPPADPAAPGTFALADADRVRLVLSTAGWREVNLTRHDLPLRLGSVAEADAAADLVSWMGPLARRLPGLTEVARVAALRAVAGALRAHAQRDELVLTASIWIVSARA
ncbi:MAG: methyltransferase domain-containing protein [Proteobacteria bacterium]|nr:methyltransferase domain-containing protein [Pseudomonadota bacterium]